jgi:ribonuclease-3
MKEKAETLLNDLSIPSLLFRRAMTHRSFHNTENNRNFAFLGDALLKLIVSEYLYNHSPESSIGELTKKRAIVVNDQYLAHCAKCSGLHQHLILGKGEMYTQGNEKVSILAEAFEALIGVLYLEHGYDYAYQFIKKTVIPEHIDTKDWNAKGQLQELVQTQGHQPPLYSTTANTDSDQPTFEIEVSVNGQIFGKGRGRSIKEAEEHAAHNALKIFSESDELVI